MLTHLRLALLVAATSSMTGCFETFADTEDRDVYFRVEAADCKKIAIQCRGSDEVKDSGTSLKHPGQ